MTTVGAIVGKFIRENKVTELKEYIQKNNLDLNNIKIEFIYDHFENKKEHAGRQGIITNTYRFYKMEGSNIVEERKVYFENDLKENENFSWPPHIVGVYYKCNEDMLIYLFQNTKDLLYVDKHKISAGRLIGWDSKAQMSSILYQEFLSPPEKSLFKVLKRAPTTPNHQYNYIYKTVDIGGDLVLATGNYGIFNFDNNLNIKSCTTYKEDGYKKKLVINVDDNTLFMNESDLKDGHHLYFYNIDTQEFTKAFTIKERYVEAIHKLDHLIYVIPSDGYQHHIYDLQKKSKTEFKTCYVPEDPNIVTIQKKVIILGKKRPDFYYQVYLKDVIISQGSIQVPFKFREYSQGLVNSVVLKGKYVITLIKDQKGFLVFEFDGDKTLSFKKHFEKDLTYFVKIDEERLITSSGQNLILWKFTENNGEIEFHELSRKKIMTPFASQIYYIHYLKNDQKFMIFDGNGFSFLIGFEMNHFIFKNVVSDIEFKFE